ncbi:ParB/RepB/Spo0J family partition protein [Limnochorda pilosa]|uniref:Chromosome partitioning protein ParB n=1 Tax=Limnochorda pilosa TaxID=1555112 RepID=A0A0K2SR15_LIMPI|nr:ParB/RepB/Spo0J family partition protein [Limnochorda pilosa]BAS29457.1 chromosome partitioning protein ParB [Limnochorda pilosa]
MSRLGDLLKGRAREEEGGWAREQVQRVPVDRIDPNPYQPRQAFDPESLVSLRESIRQHGMLQPIVVRRARDDGRYQLVAGERRLQAVRALGWEEVPAIVRSVEDRELAELALIENLQRQDLHFLEEARGYQRLLEEFGLTQRDLAERVGKGQSTIANKLRLLHLAPGVLEIVRQRGLTERHARALLQLDGPEAQREAAEVIARREMTVREAEAWIARRKEKDRQAGRKRVWVLKDVRLFLNGVEQLVKQVRASGVPVEWQQEQDGEWIELRVRVRRKGIEDRG